MSGNPILSVDQHTDALATNLPSGRVWNAKFRRASNLFKLLRGFAPTFRQMDGVIQRYVDQVIPPDTQDLLVEWEAALGIPDSCFKVALDDDTRRRNIRIKLAVLAGISTEQDFIDLAALFGLTIEISSGIEHVAVASGGYETETPALTIPGDFANVAEARLTMVVKEFNPAGITFPWDFSAATASIPAGLKFSSADQNSLRCVINKLKPANTQVLFIEG